MEKKSSTLKKNELIAVKLHKELVRYVFVQFHFFHMVVMQQFKKILWETAVWLKVNVKHQMFTYPLKSTDITATLKTWSYTY